MLYVLIMLDVLIYACCINLCFFFWWGWGTARLVVGGLGPHLCALSHCFPASTAFYPVSMVSPLKVDVFARELSNHPDQTKVSFVLNGLRYGFKLSFHPPRRLKSAKKNKPSANQHVDVIDNYLANEVALHRVAGPFPLPPLPNLHVSSFGVIPKKGQPGKWRLIVDLSSPGGLSVNDGINAEDYTMQYIRVDQIINISLSMVVGPSW